MWYCLLAYQGSSVYNEPKSLLNLKTGRNENRKTATSPCDLSGHCIFGWYSPENRLGIFACCDTSGLVMVINLVNIRSMFSCFIRSNCLFYSLFPVKVVEVGRQSTSFAIFAKFYYLLRYRSW